MKKIFIDYGDRINTAILGVVKDILKDLSNSKISIFYGSLRGGLVCANGVCAIQPEFIDGYKISFSRTL